MRYEVVVGHAIIIAYGVLVGGALILHIATLVIGTVTTATRRFPEPILLRHWPFVRTVQ